MTSDNTLLGRCTVAYAEAFETAITSTISQPNSRRAGVRAVIEQLAAELVVMNQRNAGRLSAHDAARTLLEEIHP
jgi:hypothetical protein